MSCCCGPNEADEDRTQGMVVKRRCRDVLFLLFFFAFWAGMFVICGLAFKGGDSNRLVYGIDSYGFTCGSKNTYGNSSFDLSNATNLYYLNAMDVLDSTSAAFAKTVCTPECPTETCDPTSGFCGNDAQFVCPYYYFAESNLYGKLPGVGDTDTTYFGDFPNINVSDSAAQAYVDKVKALGSPWAGIVTALGLDTATGTISGKYYQLQSQFPGNGPCYPVLVESKQFFHRCFPKFPDSLTSKLVQATSSAVTSVAGNATGSLAKKWEGSSEKWSRYVADISKGILIIAIAGLVGGIVLSLLWLIILRYLAGFMCWMTIILVNLLTIAVCIYCWVMAGYIGNDKVHQTVDEYLPGNQNPTADEQKTWFYIAIGSSVVAGLILLITILCITRLRIAVACIKVASQSIAAMPSIIFFPLLPFVFEVGLVIYWIAVTAMLYSAGDLTAHCRAPRDYSYTIDQFQNVSNLQQTFNPFDTTASPTTSVCYKNATSDQRASLCGDDPNCYLSYDWNNQLKYAFIYHFFGLLWTNQVIVGFSCVTIAGAVGSFYWSRGDSKYMPTFPVLAALKNTVIYHMGSIAFAAIIIAIIQFIRFLLEYLNQKTKELQEANKLAQWLMCCVRCCMWCLEKIVMFINRNAYILMAIKGTGYCHSACQAVKLIVSNALRMAVVNLVGDILIFLGKISVAAGCGLAAFGLSEVSYYNDPVKYPDTFLSSPVLPIALSVITGFVVAEIFFAVYEMAIDTILLAFCEDCDANDGNPKYAPPLLMEVMGQVAPASKADAR